MAAKHRNPHPDSDPYGLGIFTVDPDRPIEVVVHNRRGDITVRGVDRQDIALRSEDMDDADADANVSLQQDGNRLEIRVEPHGRRARRAGRPGRPGRPGADGSDAASGMAEIFRRREGQFGKGGVTGSWQIDFDEHIRHELRDLLPFRGGGSYDLEIEVPVSEFEVRVEAHTATGDVEIRDIHGAVDVATASGEISLKRVSGDLTVQTASGEIEIAEATGSLRARSASGDVNVRDGSLEQGVMTTASGDIDIAATLIGAGPYRIDAVSGDIDLRLEAPDHILARGFTIPFKTVSGDGRVSGLRQVNRRLWRSGDGDAAGIEIALRTVSGDANVTLTRSEASAPTATPDDATIPLPPEPPQPPQPPEPPAIVTHTAPYPAIALGDAPAKPGNSGPDQEAKDAVTAQDWTFETQDAAFAAQDSVLEAQEAALAAQDSAIEAQGAATTGDAVAVEAAGAAIRRADSLTRIADEMAAALATEPAPVAPDDASTTSAADRLTILAALERGDIDIDEAMRRLDALPSSA